MTDKEQMKHQDKGKLPQTHLCTLKTSQQGGNTNMAQETGNKTEVPK